MPKDPSSSEVGERATKCAFREIVGRKIVGVLFNGD